MRTPINKISGIGPYTADILLEHGYRCVEDLAATNEASLSKVPGFGLIRAKSIIEAARVLCDSGSSGPNYSQLNSAAIESIPKGGVGKKTAIDKAAGDHLGKKNKSKKKDKKKNNQKEKKAKKEKKQKKEKKSDKPKKPATKKKKKKDN